METSPLSILYIIPRRASFLLSCNVNMWRECSIVLTLDVFLCLFVSYLAARRCTISSLQILTWVCRSQTVLAYSISGLTSVKYACCLMAIAPMLRFLRRKTNGSVCLVANVLYVSVPFEVFCNGDNYIFRGRYIGYDVVMQLVFSFHWFPLAGYCQFRAFVRVDPHLPLALPLL